MQVKAKFLNCGTVSTEAGLFDLHFPVQIYLRFQPVGGLLEISLFLLHLNCLIMNYLFYFFIKRSLCDSIPNSSESYCAHIHVQNKSN